MMVNTNVPLILCLKIPLFYHFFVSYYFQNFLFRIISKIFCFELFPKFFVSYYLQNLFFRIISKIFCFVLFPKFFVSYYFQSFLFRIISKIFCFVLFPKQTENLPSTISKEACYNTAVVCLLCGTNWEPYR